MKIFKKSMCLLLAVVMVLGMAITASAVETTETMSVTASKANPAVGEEFSIYLNASGNIAECGCFQMDLYYDQDLFEYVGANTAFTPNHNTNKTTGARYIRLTWLDLTSQTVIPKGQFCELKFRVLKAGEYHFQLTNIVISDYKGDAIMNVATAPGSVDVAATEAPAFVGYAVSASEDKAVTVGESAEVKINVSNSDSIITTYNAYDLTLTYDTDKLTYNSCTAADALAVVKEDVPGTIRVIGFGDDKNLDTPAATLSFTAKGTGEAEVKITSAKVDIGSQAVGSDAPAAFLLDDTTVIKVTGYTVTLGEGLSGESTVAPGADYTFTAIDADNYDYVISATMGGETTAANDNGNGTYTIAGKYINGDDISITVSKISPLDKFDFSVYEYVKVDGGKSVFLILANVKSGETLGEGKVPAYDGSNMYTDMSGRYDHAYSWLVFSESDAAALQADVKNHITLVTGEAKSYKSNNDVNYTGTADINDAQLVYNIYNAKYDSFDVVEMKMFLSADINGDKVVNVQDAGAIARGTVLF